MKNFISNLFANLLALIIYTTLMFVVFIGMIGVLASTAQVEKTQPMAIKAHSVLKLDINGDVCDRVTNDLQSSLNQVLNQSDPQVGMVQIVRSIEAAASDPNIDGIMLELGDNFSAGISTIDEIRKALLRFRESGKFVVSYGLNYTQGSYFMATAANRIYINPMGELTFKGLSVGVMMYKDLLDKLGVEATVFKCGKFKSATEPYLLSHISNENRLQYQMMVDDFWSYMLNVISQSRNIEPQKLNQMADNLLVEDASAAQKFGLVDQVCYLAVVEDSLKQMTTTNEVNYVSFSDYMQNVRLASGSQKVAIIYAEGEIVSNATSTATQKQFDYDMMAKVIDEVEADSTIKAVVLRVNSPGGDAIASEFIHGKLEMLKKTKPVVVSMGEYAASGGYYISCPSSAIVANELTLTGSIGVFGLTLNLQKLLNDKLGVNYDVVKTNKNADFMSSLRKYSPRECAYMQHMVDSVYTLFKQRVADGRSLNINYVDQIAQGRVWTGIAAKQNGLVDYFGDLASALSLAAQMANIPLSDFGVVDYPKEKDMVTQIMEMMGTKMQVRSKSPIAEKIQTVIDNINSLQTRSIQARLEQDILVY